MIMITYKCDVRKEKELGRYEKQNRVCTSQERATVLLLNEIVIVTKHEPIKVFP